jgi:ferredoxin
MARQRKVYARRRLLRGLEKIQAFVDRLVDQATQAGAKAAPYNPFYHLGTLTIFLLISLIVTGIYLTIFYRPGSDRAYLSVLGMDNTWLGSLMRTVHRYASDAIIIVAFLHAWKMLISDRFWGGRWLAWVSGWLMMVVIWIMGLMGFWLVWDQTAQWLTEYFLGLAQGPFAYSILAGGDLAASTYALFVIILFLHIFIPPAILGFVLIHVLRLSRSRYWSPRWLMIASVIALTLLAILRPAPLDLPANMDSLITEINLDWLYLGFLPLVEWVGGPLFWGGSILLLLAVMALPWLWPGQHEGPSIVIDAKCTGCSACARECPYDAIEMVQRDDDTEFESLAVVSPGKCTGCGICIGACHDDAIELDRLYSAVVRQDLQRTSAQGRAAGQPPITVYMCDRHDVLGTVPPVDKSQPIGGSIPLMQAKLPPRVNVGVWRDSEGEAHPVITAVTPCTGMLHPNWVAQVIESGSAGAIVVSCPIDDCSHREGPHWIADRLKRRRTFRKGNTHFLELAPGSQKEVTALWEQMVRDEEEARLAATAVGSAAGKQAPPPPPQKLRYLAAGFAALLLIFLATAFITQTAVNQLPEQGQLRIVINHAGELVNSLDNLDPEVAAKLPENVDPSLVLGGERFPVRLRVTVDGELTLEDSFEPGGLRREGIIFGNEEIWLPPGAHNVAIQMMDDGATWRPVFTGEVIVPDGGVSSLIYDEIQGMFVEKSD